MIFGMKEYLTVIVVFSLALSLPSLVGAHVSERTFEQMIDGRLMDIGYDTPLLTGSETLLDFVLYDMEDGALSGVAGYTTVQAAVFSGSTVAWETFVTVPEFGKVFAVFTPKQPGNWTLKATFLKDDVVLADAEFPLIIDEGVPMDKPRSRFVFFVAAVLVLVAAAGTMFRKRSA